VVSGQTSALPQARARRATLPAGVTWMLAKGEHRSRKFPTANVSKQVFRLKTETRISPFVCKVYWRFYRFLKNGKCVFDSPQGRHSSLKEIESMLLRVLTVLKTGQCQSLVHIKQNCSHKRTQRTQI
jgi:hypothetical protein